MVKLLRFCHCKEFFVEIDNRGDTAGTYTKAPDVILEGAGMTIGFGAVRYLRRKNATIEVTLNETGWYHIPVTLYDIEARFIFHSLSHISKAKI